MKNGDFSIISQPSVVVMQQPGYPSPTLPRFRHRNRKPLKSQPFDDDVGEVIEPCGTVSDAPTDVCLILEKLDKSEQCATIGKNEALVLPWMKDSLSDVSFSDSPYVPRLKYEMRGYKNNNQEPCGNALCVDDIRTTHSDFTKPPNTNKVFSPLRASVCDNVDVGDDGYITVVETPKRQQCETVSNISYQSGRLYPLDEDSASKWSKFTGQRFQEEHDAGHLQDSSVLSCSPCQGVDHLVPVSPVAKPEIKLDSDRDSSQDVKSPDDIFKVSPFTHTELPMGEQPVESLSNHQATTKFMFSPPSDTKRFKAGFKAPRCVREAEAASIGSGKKTNINQVNQGLLYISAEFG